MQNPYETYNNKIGVRLSFLVADEVKQHTESLELLSYSAYEKRARRTEGFRLRKAGGAGNEVLVSYDAMPLEWQDAFRNKFGDPYKQHNPLEKYFKIDGSARLFYEGHQFDDKSFLKPEQIEKYTINASVLNAVQQLKQHREVSRKMRNGSSRGIWTSLISDCTAFNEILKSNYGVEHSLPNSDKLRRKLKQYASEGYICLIDGRNKNQSAQIVTPVMVDLWTAIYAGQRGRKPDYKEVWDTYSKFLLGAVDIVNNDTGEVYDHTSPDFKKVSDNTIYNYQSSWEVKVVTHAARSGDRQKYMSKYKPYHKLERPKFSGERISIDDRQPPFKDLSGKRMWFYNGIDLASGAFVCWVYGETKEGLILEFYRQLIRNYHEWGLKLPYELECESSLNSSFKNTFLKPGCMFQEVRIEANNARGKRIEAYYRQLRYKYEKNEEGWLARPHALSESNQAPAEKVPKIAREQIIYNALSHIEMWNNHPHEDQDTYPNKTKWDVFLDNQHPDLPETNWRGILPHIGFRTRSSMQTGRVKLQHKERVVGFNGKVAIGDDLISIMSKIEGKEFTVFWLDGNNGEVMKAIVLDDEDRYVCDVLDDLAYNRSTLSRTPLDEEKRALTTAYVATVDRYVKQQKHNIQRVTIIKKETSKQGRFKMPGLNHYDSTEQEQEVKVLPPVEEEVESSLNNFSNGFKTNTADRF